MASRTGHIDKATNLQTKLSKSEEKQRLHKHWQLYDLLLWRVGCGSAADLADYVSEPEHFVENRGRTALTFSDQIPVWLKPGSGRVLQARSTQRLAAKATKRRRQRKAGEGAGGQAGEGQAGEEQAAHVHDHVRGPGESQDKKSAQLN